MKKGFSRYFVLILFLILFIEVTNFANAAITVVAPASNTNHTGTAVFNVSYVNATDITDAVNASFYYNISGSWTLIGSTLVCKNNNITFISSCNATLDISTLIDGRYSINATISNTTDFGSGASTITQNVLFDSTPPTVSTAGNFNNSGTFNLNISVSDGGIGIDSVYFNVTYPNGTVVAGNYTKASTSGGGYYNVTIIGAGFTEGRYNVSVYANDTLNNLNNSEQIQMIIDRTAPTAAFSCSPSPITASGTVTCTCTPSDALSSINSALTTYSYTGNPPVSSTGTQTVYCYFTDTAGNTGNASATYVVNPIVSSIIVNETSVNIMKKINSWEKITSGATVIMKDFNTDIGVKQIQITVNNEAQNVKITVTKYQSKPAGVSIAKSGKVNKYFQIKEENLGNKLEKATLEIQVEKSWLSDNGFNKSDIALFRFDETTQKWNELNTQFKDEDSKYYYYDTELTGFSYFTIAEKTAAVSETPLSSGKTEKNLMWWGLAGIIILVAIVVGAVILSKRRKK